MLNSLTSVALAIALGVAALPSHAQSNCGLRDDVVQRLTEHFGEALTGGGLRSETQVVEVWASPQTGSWTVLITRANGVTCVMASGTNWHHQDPELVPMGLES